MKKLYALFLSLFAFMAASFPALAQSTIDVSEATTMISVDGKAAAVAVGAAVIGFLGVVLVYRLIRRVF